MKPKMLLYTALGYTTFKVGKVLGRKRVRAAVRELRHGDSRHQAGRRV